MRTILLIVLLGIATFHAHAQNSGGVQETLTGQPLRAPQWSDAVRDKLEMDLTIARAVFAVAPEREESYIWLGRRLGYLGRYSEAIEVFTAGLEKFPKSFKLHRFRGRHRARNREFDLAIADYREGLQKMRGTPDSFEPDGLPNALGLTISTYRSNLHYYLGQTSFATGDYRQMVRELDLSGESSIAIAKEEHRIARVFWKYLAHRKLNEDAQAEALLASVPLQIDLIENDNYHRAIQVLQGVVSAELAETRGDSLSRFALGMRLLFDGNRDESTRILSELVAANALGYWPAEVELVRRMSE